jgi:glycosyltransferase involved in cell wall biosynthesis
MIENVGKPNDGIIRVLNVGRFIAGGHCKKQLELIQAFNIFTEELSQKGIKSKLTLMGSLGSSEDDRNYLGKVRQLAGNNVEIIVNGSRENIIHKYQESNFYWHGTGIDEDVIENPQVFEHFGITPVEAMSAGCIPIVWHEGGPSEILDKLGLDGSLHKATSVNSYVFNTIKLLEVNNFTINTSRFSESFFLNNLEVCINAKA